jgi:N-methylhydantoinase A
VVSRAAPLAVVGVDTGGTFTDLLVCRRGQLLARKVLSTPHDPAEAVLRGLAELLPEGEPALLTYSSTVATNALLERRGARVLLLTTRGFEDVIEIGRQNRPDLYALEPRRVPPLVPRDWRVGVAERMLFDGRALLPLAAAEVERVLALVARRKPQAVAVCFLHSYVNPKHERRITTALEKRFPELFVCASHALIAEHREYERFSTAVINAYVGPVMSAHVRRLGQALTERGVQWRVLQSNGGAIPPALAVREVVRTCLSGPAGGVRGALRTMREAGIERAVSFDMGGTSTDVSLIDRGVSVTTDWTIAGLPLKVPSVDVHTVGAGGGSIAACDEAGALKVGPQSAGADPGPACYGRALQATVTDANLLLGRLLPERFLGGQMRLFPERARAALATLGMQLGCSPEEAALGVVRVANANMERAIRRISVERGHDLRRFTLLAFGGAAGQHACELAEELGMPQVLLPALPGLLSALGAATAPVQRDGVVAVHRREPEYSELAAVIDQLAEELGAELERLGIPRRSLRVRGFLDVRYVGQSYELLLPARPDYAAVFARRHRQFYGYADPQRPLEVVHVRVQLTAAAPRWATATRPPPSGSPAPLGERRVFSGGRWLRATVWDREQLPVGAELRGPALLVEMSTTTWLPPNWRAQVLPAGHLLLTRANT